MSVLLYLLTLILCIFSLSYPICTDKVINVHHNIREDFVVNNVYGIGLVGVPQAFRDWMHIDGVVPKVLSGQLIYSIFKRYVKIELCLPVDEYESYITNMHQSSATHYNTLHESQSAESTSGASCLLEHLLHSNNTDVDKLIQFSKLPGALFA